MASRYISSIAPYPSLSHFAMSTSVVHDQQLVRLKQRHAQYAET
jgi:hypothetical protein